MKPQNSENQAENRRIAIFAATMAAGTMFSRVLGLIRDIVTTTVFDRTVTDAWLVAYRLPNLFRRILGEGSLSIAFIPVFVSTLTKDPNYKENSQAQQLANGIFTLLLGGLTVLTALGIIYAETVLSYLVPGEGFMSIPGKFELTVYMAKIMFGFIFFISVYAYFMALLNSFKRFVAGAFAPTLFNISLIASAYVPHSEVHQGENLAWAVLIGGFLQAAALIPSLIHQGCLPKLTLKLNSPELKKVFSSMIPSWVGVGILQITGLINVRLGSELGEGTHSWIYIADRILELPLALFAVSVGSALLPTLSQYWSRGQKDEMIETTTYYIKLTLFLSVPAAVGLYLLATPIVEVLFHHGKFSVKDVQMTSSLLKIYSFAILTYGGIRVIVAPFYAIHNTWVPAVISAVCLLFHWMAASHWVYVWGVKGITASSVMSSAVNLTLLLSFHTYFVGSLRFLNLLKSFATYALCAIIMGLFLAQHQYIYETLEGLLLKPRLSQQLSLFFTISGGILIYFIAAYSLNADGFQDIVGRLKAKIFRKSLKKP